MAGDFLVGMCYAGKVPLQIGLHKTHGDYPIEEVHTQVVGFGKMQECREKDLATLYREDRMSPGYTHPIMFNEQLEYPWHQFETVTEGIFMSVANHSRKPKER